jgi:DNA-directed RNA polymerase specialized sigma24 family protein
VTSRLTDAELVARCREGDEEAWAELVERFSRYVYAIAVQGFRLSEQDAEDVFQEVFARTYERLDRLRERARVEPTEDIETGADETLAQLDLALDVREALDALGDPCSDLLDRFFCRDESYRTIGERLELPPGTIASRISRCLAKMRVQLEGRNDRPAASGG